VTTAAKVRIVDSLIRDNANYGVYLQSGATADISGTKVLGNAGAGVAVFGLVDMTTTSAAISDSVISGNAGIGIDAYAQTDGASVYVSVSRSTVSNNEYGIVSQSNSAVVAVTISSNLVTKNSVYGLYQLGTAILESQGNNTVRQNGIDKFGTIITVSGI
jgi:hypothetical protein